MFEDLFNVEDEPACGKDMINLSNKRDSKWLEVVLDDYVRDMNYRSAAALLLSVKEYKSADRVRKCRILDDVISILSGMKSEGSDHKAVFKSLISKGLITVSDASYCIRGFRDKDLHELIPLMILAENGFIACGKENI